MTIDDIKSERYKGHMIDFFVWKNYHGTRYIIARSEGAEADGWDKQEAFNNMKKIIDRLG